MTSSPLSAIILAAGEGTRMRSSRPKPLHLLCGQAMLLYVLDALSACDVDRIVVVVGHGAERVTKKLQEQRPELNLDFVEQHVQRGTGDAVSVGLTAFSADELDAGGDVLVLPGDTPLLRPSTMADLVEHHRETGAAATLLTARLDDPSGYGRVLRSADGAVLGTVEHADATDEQRAVDEINTGIYCFGLTELPAALRRLSPENAQGEYYLPDALSVLRDAGYPIGAVVADDGDETHGVNDRIQLSAAEAELRRRTNASLMRQGVTMVDPTTTYVDTTVALSPDVTIFPGTMLQGRTVVGAGSELGPGTRLVDCIVGDECVLERTTAREAQIGDRCRLGPYAVVEPGSDVPSDTRSGPFYTADVTADHGREA
jgi:bifunctional UDP-N-acetylglucosamine pyrophosphorylase/glucosamine-1-phosphate N-acetyltransferase